MAALYKFEWNNEGTGETLTLTVYDSMYVGPVKVRNLGASPVIRQSSFDNVIAPTTLAFTMEALAEDGLTPLYSTDPRRYRVYLTTMRQISETMVSEVTLWAGYIEPELYAAAWQNPPFDVDVNAVDGLSLLKDIPYSVTDDDDTRRSLISVIWKCLNNIDGNTHPSLFVQNSLRLYSSIGMELLGDSDIHEGMFEGKTCYEVLEDICRSLNAVLTSYMGNFALMRIQDTDSPLNLWINGSSSHSGTQARSLVNLGLPGETGVTWSPAGVMNMELMPGKKSQLSKFRWSARESLLANARMDVNASWNSSMLSDAEIFYPGDKPVTGGGTVHLDYYIIASLHADVNARLYQSVSVVKGIPLTFKLSTLFVYSLRDGDSTLNDPVLPISIQLSDGNSQWHFDSESGEWKTGAGQAYGNVRVSLKSIGTTWRTDFAPGYIISRDQFTDTEISIPAPPVSGTLTISFYNMYQMPTHGFFHFLLGGAYLMPDVELGYDITVTGDALFIHAAEDAEPDLADLPSDYPYADVIWRNGVTVNGEGSNSWVTQLDPLNPKTLLTILNEERAQLWVAARKQLSGNVMMKNADLPQVVYAGSVYGNYRLWEYTWNLLDNTAQVTLKEIITSPVTITEETERTVYKEN